MRLFLLVFLIGCQTGVKFDPNFHIGDYLNQAIVDRNGSYVYSDEEKFNQYACMHETKVKELAEILKKARIPKKSKFQMLKTLNIPFQK